MPSFEGLLLGGTIVVLALLGVGLLSVLRRGGGGPATTALGEGRFAEALARTEAGRASRDELYAGAVAAKHLLELDRATALLDRILAADPGDGEARLERGLVAAYAALLGSSEREPQEKPDLAPEALADLELERAQQQRSDLGESITLHRAWLALRTGDRTRARRLFDEVEIPLETKLRSDLGTGEPLFAEWFLQAAALWSAFGEEEKARWAREQGAAAAPESRLPQIV